MTVTRLAIVAAIVLAAPASAVAQSAYVCQAHQRLAQGEIHVEVPVSPSGVVGNPALRWTLPRTTAAHGSAELAIDFAPPTDATALPVPAQAFLTVSLNFTPQRNTDMVASLDGLKDRQAFYRTPSQAIVVGPGQITGVRIGDRAIVRALATAPALPVALVQSDGAVLDQVEIPIEGRAEALTALVEAWRDAMARAPDRLKRCQPLIIDE